MPMYELTRADVTALRRADAVCFDTDRSEGMLRAITRGRDHQHETTHRIPAHVSSIQNYGAGGGNGYHCFAMIMSAKYDEQWQTIARLITPGCWLGLRWTRNNSRPVTNEVGIVVDHCDLIVVKGDKRMVFRVSTYIGFDHSARMVRTY